MITNYIRQAAKNARNFWWICLIRFNPRDIKHRYLQAVYLEDGTHNKKAQVRDLLLKIIVDIPEIKNNPSNTLHIKILRGAASRCNDQGPIATAKELYSKLCQVSNDAKDHFEYSEIMYDEVDLSTSVTHLEKAMNLNPEVYDSKDNRDLLSSLKQTLTLKNSQSINKKLEESQHLKKPRIVRYPSSSELKGNLKDVVRNHLQNDFSNFGIHNKSTKIFTMGSCFARNISRKLQSLGLICENLEIAEQLNSSYANVALVDYILGRNTSSSNNSRLEELLGDAQNKEYLLNKIIDTNVLILTLGVAPVLFSRYDGSFVMPRPSRLTTRALADKYEWRTTTVEENVRNIKYVIESIRTISPGIKVVLTVSPVPLSVTFEFGSAICADSLSKSIMRVSADQLVRGNNLENIYYWPSFEVFRWVGSHNSNFFGGDDGAEWHVTEGHVNEVMSVFAEYFSREN